MREYIRELMDDKRCDPVSQCAKVCLLPLSYIYGCLITIHHFFYKINLLKSRKVPIPVISVGNITLGGTGKTPFVIMLAERLAKKKKTAVLIRGYGDDEWKMLEERFKNSGVKVFVGRDRVKRAERARSDGFEILVLDDGFQHRRLKRDLDIVLLDSTNPFGNRHLFPRGVLRDGLATLGKAGIIVLTKVDKGGDNVSMLEEEIKKIAPQTPVIRARHKAKNLSRIDTGSVMDISFIKDKTVCLVSAICDPVYFRHTVEKIGARLGAEFIFSDHYLYKQSDLGRIFKKCEDRDIGIVVTTEKDVVKLKALEIPETGPQILALAIELEIESGEKELENEINRLYSSHFC